MDKILFEKTGIKITAIQKKILKEFFWGIIKSAIIAAILLVAAFVTNAITPDCGHLIFSAFLSSSHDFACVNQNHIVPEWVSGVIIALIVVTFVPFLTDGATYLSKLVSNEDFREKEMAASVDYKEDDEVERMKTMSATRRAYMVLNFTLLVFWLVSLVTGNFGTAVTVFIAQAIGTLSYRRGRRD